MRTLLPLATLLITVAPVQSQSMRDLAAERGITIGAAVEPARLNEPQFVDVLVREFNQIEAENSMKFGPMRPTRATYDFGPADVLASFAQSRGMAFRGHVLVWHNQNPAWLTSGSFTPAELSTILEDHIRTIVGRYAGKVYAWDVVNEAFNDGAGGTLRSTLWSDAPGIGATGTGYIERAFRWAREADPKALLFYNDYSNEAINAKSDAIFRMAQDFKARGVPIDGIGLQMHLTENPPSMASIEANIKRITDLGLRVHITELDVRIPVDASGNATQALLTRQGQVYRDAVAVCLKFRLCDSIQTWGLTDRYSWIPSTFPGTGAGLPFDRDYRPKPAYEGMVAALRGSPPAITAVGLTNAASYASTAFAPGEIFVLFGPTFGPSALALAQPVGGRIPAELSQTRVLFDNVPAPLLYSTVGQVSGVVPFSVAGKTTVQMQYEYRGVRSNAVTVNIVPTQPGIFTLDSSGTGNGAILDTSYRVIDESNRARKGDYILVYLTGAGVMTPASRDGEIAGASPVPTVPGQVTLTIGGVDCPVQYAGEASGLVAGAVQLNAQITGGVPSGRQPIVVTINGRPSQSGVTVWVQ
jgi:endo-1,4-beta-xylanase